MTTHLVVTSEEKREKLITGVKGLILRIDWMEGGGGGYETFVYKVNVGCGNSMFKTFNFFR